MPSRIIAVAAIVALAALPLLVCCTTMFAMQPGGCCKGHCASVSAATSFVAVAQAKVRVPGLALAATLGRDATMDRSAAEVSSVEPASSALFAPIATIQLRI